MSTEGDQRRDRSYADELREPAKTARRLFHRGSRLDKVLERNARWAAEARTTPPLYAQDVA